MAMWAVRGFGADGAPVSARIEAPTRETALAAAARRRIVAGDVRLAGAGGAPAGPPLSARQRIALLRELGTLLSAHVPLPEALGTLGESGTEPAVREAAGRLGDAVARGTPLSRAMAGLLASEASAATIAAAEARGALGSGLLRLADALERHAALARAVVGALVYPAVLLGVTLASLALILLVVVPNLEPLLRSAGDAAPGSAQALLAASALLRAQGAEIAGALALGGLVAARLGRGARGRRWLERALLRLPALGPLLRAIETASALRLIAGLIGQGVALPDALAMAGRAARTRPTRDALAAVAAAVREGEALEPALRRQSALAPGVAGFAAIGSRSGRLGALLDSAAETLEREGEARIARLMALLPPALTVLLGLLVGGFSLTILSAILSANDLAF